MTVRFVAFMLGMLLLGATSFALAADSATAQLKAQNNSNESGTATLTFDPRPEYHPVGRTMLVAYPFRSVELFSPMPGGGDLRIEREGLFSPSAGIIQETQRIAGPGDSVRVLQRKLEAKSF